MNKVLAMLSGKRGNAGEESASAREDARLAVAALLVEAALMSEDFSDQERETIERLLSDRYDLDAPATRDLVKAAEAEAARSNQLFGFTKQVVHDLDEAERIQLIEMLWEVAYADGHLDAYEDSLLRRVAGLIHIPDVARGQARLRVLERLGIEP